MAALAVAGLLPLVAWLLGWRWYLDSPLLLVVALLAGLAAGVGLPRVPAVAVVVGCVSVLVLVNQVSDAAYHWIDDTVFFLVVVGGGAVAGGGVRIRATQAERLRQLAEGLDEQRRVAVAAARLEEQVRVQEQVHTRLAERIAGIVVRAEGALRSPDPEDLHVLEDEARAVLDQLREALGSLAAAPSADEPSPVHDEVPDRPSRPSGPDAALAAGLGLGCGVELVVVGSGPAWAAGLLGLAMAAPLVVRRTRPATATGLSLLVAAPTSAWLAPVPATVSGLALLSVLAYSVGVWCSRGRWLVVWLLGAVATVGVVRLGGLALVTAGAVVAWTAAALALGRLVATWHQRVRQTAALVAELENGRDADARLATARQREELAGELHDTVAHAMTVVCLQAGGVRRTGGDPAPALRTIIDTAAVSVVELRDGLDSLEAVERPLATSRLRSVGRRVGVDVAVSGDGHDARGPTAGLAFRVVREAIVNVSRHAPGARADVELRRDDAGLALVVRNAAARHPVPGLGTGSGLAGLGRAVDSAGGWLSHRTLPGGGFAVEAWIPEVPA